MRHGILPGTAPEMLPGIVGAARARRLSLFAEYVDADEAPRIGLVDKVVPRESLEGEARQLGQRVCGFSASALHECKSLLARAGTLDTAGYDRAFAEAQQRCLDARVQN